MFQEPSDFLESSTCSMPKAAAGLNENCLTRNNFKLSFCSPTNSLPPNMETVRKILKFSLLLTGPTKAKSKVPSPTPAKGASPHLVNGETPKIIEY